jgi:hypothetical protein
MNKFLSGHIILAIDGEHILRAGKIEATPEGFLIDDGAMQIAASQLTHAWRIIGPETVPVKTLEERAKICGAILDLELSAEKFRKESGKQPWAAYDTPVIFGAASLALTLVPERTSDDVDMALSPEFIAWRRKNWPSMGVTATETLPFGVFAYCGNWKSRATVCEGLTGITIRMLHPLDTAIQKLLRIKSPEEKFEKKDKGDIAKIIAALNPSEELLLNLLTENHFRYIEPAVEPGDRGRNQMLQYESIKSNTAWFLSQYLPGCSFEEICKLSFERRESELGRLIPQEIERKQQIRISGTLGAENILGADK